jgi:hypothetical protein
MEGNGRKLDRKRWVELNGVAEFLSAADEGNDFQPVAVPEDRFAMSCAGDHFEIQLNGDLRLLDFQRAEQRGDGAAIW